MLLYVLVHILYILYFRLVDYTQSPEVVSNVPVSFHHYTIDPIVERTVWSHPQELGAYYLTIEQSRPSAKLLAADCLIWNDRRFGPRSLPFWFEISVFLTRIITRNESKSSAFWAVWWQSRDILLSRRLDQSKIRTTVTMDPDDWSTNQYRVYMQEKVTLG